MLKIKNTIFALSLTPFMSLAWQLPSLAQVSVGTAGTPSGAQTSGTNTTIFSVPPTALPGGQTTTTTTVGGQTTTAVTTTTTGQSVIIPIVPGGVSAAVTSGVSTTGTTSAATTTDGTNATVAISEASVEPTASSVTVTGTGNGLSLSVPAGTQAQLNQSAASISSDGATTGGTAADVSTVLTGSAGSQQSAVTLANSFVAAGVTAPLATALVTSLAGVFGSTNASVPSQPVAIATSGQLVASTKVLKPVTIIAQGSAGLSVNINKLNDAIVAYNAVILRSEPQVVKNLSNNSGFRGIGGILKQLRDVIK
ncbi:MAG: hypothetical protein ACKPHQ_00250 [Dolichospermum sp.]